MQPDPRVLTCESLTPALQAELQASRPLSFTCDGAVNLIEAAAGEKTPPRFSMVAYRGGAMSLDGWANPVVVDLAGVRLAAAQIPARMQHDKRRMVGHFERVEVRGSELHASGVVSFENADAKSLVSSSRNGFQWQASIGANPLHTEHVPRGLSAQANGKTFEGPVDIVRRAVLSEISFVDIGADNSTSATIAAQARGTQGPNMTTETPTPPAPPAPVTAAAPTPAAPPAAPAPRAGPPETPDAVIEAARQEQARRDRITTMVKAAIATPGADLTQLQQLAKSAFNEGWSEQTTELAILRAGRPAAPAIHKGQAPASDAVLAAATLLSCGVSDKKLAEDLDFGPRVVEAAWQHRRMGLHQLIAAALQANGMHVEHGGQGLFASLMRAAPAMRSIQASGGGFSTVNLAGILGTVGNKLLLDSFTNVAVTFQEICQLSDFNNFLTYTQYRMTAGGGYEVVGNKGEIKHADLGEESYTNRLDTRGKMVTLSRQDIINDDLGALQQLFRLLGRDAALSLEETVYDAFMEGSDVIFTSARANRLTSAALSMATLQSADAALMAQTNENGKPIYAMGSRLVVPPALKALADAIFISENVVGSTSAPEANTMRGRARPVTSPFLSLAAMTGSSASNWYLFADPALVPFLQVGFLQGKRQPTVETADAQFDTLGVSMRSYFDWGVAVVDYRGANKSST